MEDYKERIKERNELAKSIYAGIASVSAKNAIIAANDLMQEMYGLHWEEKDEADAMPTQQPKENVCVVEHNGEKWVRVCALDEDFIIAPHNYTEGETVEFDWRKACEVGTFSKRQAHIVCALIDEINAKLREIGGDELEGRYWSSSEYSTIYAWSVYFSSGSIDYGGKYYTDYVVRPVAAL